MTSIQPTNTPLRLSTLDNLSTAVLVTDLEQRIQYMNSAAEDFFAISAKQAAQFDLGSIQINQTKHFADLIAQSRQSETGYTHREVEITIHEQTRYADCSIKIISQDKQTEYALIEISTVDRILRITKEKNLIRQHITASEIARGLAHEINNPLGGIRGAAQLLEKEFGDHPIQEFTQIIISESDRLQNLIKRMLGPNTRLNMQKINIHEVLQRVVKLMRAEFSKELLFKLDYDPSIPKVTADFELLIQAILNIIRNAAQAVAGEGTITLRTRPIRRYTIGDILHKLVIKVDIIDDGPGIDAAIIERIFYPMVTNRSENSGLGLSIAQSIISQHKGLIEFDSQPGNTCFSLLLPIEAA